VVINDINPVAFELIKENVKRNSVKAEVHNRNANSLLNEVKGDLVDVDPFGSPVPFIMSSLSALRNKGLLALTATDTSALTGSSPSSCRRKYGAINQRLSFHREVGLRILISKVVSEAASVDLAAYPTLTYYTDYYYRAYFRVVKGAKRADELLKRLGYYVECNKCGYSEGRSYVDQITCPRCGNSIMRIAGPLWMGELWDQEVLEGLTSELNEFSYLPSSRRVHKLLTTLKQETPYQNFHYWKIDWLCSIRKWSIPKKEKVIQCVGRASATHLDSNGIRSDAEFEDILKCLTHTS
jgi:N2,N2-dimethylguanosine tRNA methyltransferase